jgi:hypothetical protein
MPDNEYEDGEKIPEADGEPIPAADSYANMSATGEPEPIPVAEHTAQATGGSSKLAPMMALAAVVLSLGVGYVLTQKHNGVTRRLLNDIKELREKTAKLEEATRPTSTPGKEYADPKVAQVGSFTDWMRDGLQLYEEAKYREAAPYFEAASRRRRSPMATYYLGMCCVKNNGVLRGSRLLKTVKTEFANSPFAVRSTFALAEQAITRGDYAGAQKLFYGVLAREDLLAAEDRDVVAGSLYGVGDAYAFASEKAAEEERILSTKAKAAALTKESE